MQTYANLKKEQTSIKIKSKMARKWLYKLEFKYKDAEKDVFVDRHEQLNVVKDHENFINTIKDLKPYLVEFKEDGSIKTKNHQDDYTLKGDIYNLIIVITHDECTFSANNTI